MLKVNVHDNFNFFLQFLIFIIYVFLSSPSRDRHREPNTIRKGRIIRAESGQVTVLDLSRANDTMQHMQNSFLEYTAIVRETIKVNHATCELIMRTFELRNEDLPRILHEEEKIYDNNNLKYLRGNPAKSPDRGLQRERWHFIQG